MLFPLVTTGTTVARPPQWEAPTMLVAVPLPSPKRLNCYNLGTQELEYTV